MCGRRRSRPRPPFRRRSSTRTPWRSGPRPLADGQLGAGLTPETFRRGWTHPRKEPDTADAARPRTGRRRAAHTDDGRGYLLIALIVIVIATEVEHVEQIADRRHVARHVIVGVAVIAVHRVGQVVAATRRKRGAELPVAFDEL